MNRSNSYAGLVLCLCVVVSMSCSLRNRDSFRLLATAPQYVVESPGRTRTAYSEVLETFTPLGRRWVELKPGMGLYIQNIISRDGSTGLDLSNYVGTESMRYSVNKRGKLVEFGEAGRVSPRPQEVPPVDALISDRQRQRRYHRFFYQVLIRPTDTHRVAVLVSSDSPERLLSLTDMVLSDPTALRDAPPAEADYTMFLESASVAVEMTITVDQEPTRVFWGRQLSSVVGVAPNPQLFRLHDGRWRAVQFDPSDRSFLSVPLLPGDSIER